MGFLKDKLKSLMGVKPAPQPLTEEEKRRAGDAAKLAEYAAFDTEVGATPTQETLRSRFRDAAYAGHTGVVKDTLEKGLQMPSEIHSLWHPMGGTPIMMTAVPLELAARREWADMVEVMAPHADRKNLDEALKAAESKQNIAITKAIRAEMERRENPQAQPVASVPTATEPVALGQSITVPKTLQLK